MLAFFTALAKAFDWLGQYFAQKQLLDAGKAEQQVQTQAEVETHVEQAQNAVAVPDATRTQRLRNRFDQATGNE